MEVTLICKSCGEDSVHRLSAGAVLGNDAHFLCRKCAGYHERRPRRRFSPFREILYNDISFRTPDGDQLSGEAAMESIVYHRLSDDSHITHPCLQARTRQEREQGTLRQKALSQITADELPQIEAALVGTLDADERWVMSVRAMGLSRENYLSRLIGNDRLRFQSAWRRLARKLARVQESLREQATVKRADAERAELDVLENEPRANY